LYILVQYKVNFSCALASSMVCISETFLSFGFSVLSQMCKCCGCCVHFYFKRCYGR